MNRIRIAHYLRVPLVLALCLIIGNNALAEVRSQVEGEALIAADPLEPEPYEIYAKFLVKNGAYKDAVEVLERAKVKAAPSPHLLVTLGKVYAAQNQMGKAEAVTREALDLDPKNVAALLFMGDLYLQLGWTKSGLDSYQDAVDLTPGDPAPMAKLVGGYLEAGLYPRAQELCLQFISQAPESADLWLCLGMVFEKQNKPREAFTTYGQVLTLDPDNATAYARQGRLFCEFGQFTSAEASCRQALELDPDLSLAHAYLGIALSYLGKDLEARRHAQIAEAGGLNMLSVWKKIGN